MLSIEQNLAASRSSILEGMRGEGRIAPGLVAPAVVGTGLVAIVGEPTTIGALSQQSVLPDNLWATLGNPRGLTLIADRSLFRWWSVCRNTEPLNEMTIQRHIAFGE